MQEPHSVRKLEFEALRGLGLSLALAQQLIALLPEHPDARPVRVIEVHRETVVLHDGHVERGARRHPTLARGLAAHDDAVAVGDWGLAVCDGRGDWWLLRCLAPFNSLVRRDSDGLRHVVVSNVDHALLVMGLDHDFNLNRLERFQALVEASGVVPVVVLTKPDLRADPEALVDSLRRRLPERVPVCVVDARSPQAAETLAPWLTRGRTLVLLGSSGAGKSTLTNTLLGADAQATGATRLHDGRGRHTTTSRSLHRLPGGACVIDTPGVRTLRPDAAEDGLAAGFDDIARLSLQCRFRNCRHQGEPGCAVAEGVDAGRVRNFHKLQRELQRDGMDALDRRRQLSEWKQRGREGTARLRAKRGE
jgi:ribosome biogenesis GTPase